MCTGASNLVSCASAHELLSTFQNHMAQVLRPACCVYMSMCSTLVSVDVHICWCNVRMPVLATSVQEQLETGSKSAAEVPDQPSQVDVVSKLCWIVLKSRCMYNGISTCLRWLVAWHSGRTSVLAGELSLSHARPSADGWPLMWVNCPLEVSQPGQLSLSSSQGR